MFLLIFAIVILSRLGYQGSNAKTIRLSASLALLPIRSNATSALLRPPSFITQAYAVPILAQRATAARGVISALPVWVSSAHPANPGKVGSRKTAKWSGRSVADSATAAPEKL